MPCHSRTKAAEARRRAKLAELASKVPDPSTSETTSDLGSGDVSTIRVPHSPPDIHFIELFRKVRQEDTGYSLAYLRSAEKHVSKAGNFKYESANSKHWRRKFHAYWECRVLKGQSPGNMLKSPPCRSQELTEELETWRKHADSMWMKIGKIVLAAHRLGWIKADAIKRLREDMNFQNFVDYEMHDDSRVVDDRRSPMTTEELKNLVAAVQRYEEQEEGEWYIPLGIPTSIGRRTIWHMLGRPDRGFHDWPKPWKSAEDRMNAYHLMARNIDFFGSRHYRSEPEWYTAY